MRYEVSIRADNGIWVQLPLPLTATTLTELVNSDQWKEYKVKTVETPTIPPGFWGTDREAARAK